MAKKKSNIKTSEILKLYQSGLSSEQIGKKLGFAKSSISRRLKKSGVTLRNSSDYSGEKRYWLWKGIDHLPEITRKRNQLKHRKWSLNVRKRDGYKCTKCGSNDIKLEAHHIVGLSECLNTSLEFDINNGTTLCIPCHRSIHKDI